MTPLPKCSLGVAVAVISDPNVISAMLPDSLNPRHTTKERMKAMISSVFGASGEHANDLIGTATQAPPVNCRHTFVCVCVARMTVHIQI